MAQIIYTASALADLERAFEFLADRSPEAGAKVVATIRHAVEILSSHPLIGRNADAGLRELVISYGKTGYVALYWFAPELSEIWVLGIRHQRELDYRP